MTTPADRVRVVVCNDRALLREGLRRAWAEEKWIDIVAEGGNVDEAVEACREHEDALVAKLSERETEVLRFLALGYTNLEMAEALSLSVRTVETYRMRLLHKVGLRSRADLVRLARHAGLVR